MSDSAENTPQAAKPDRKCTVISANGTRCGCWARRGLPFCHIHDPEAQDSVAGARKRGGQFRAARKPPQAAQVTVPLNTPADALAVIRATLAQVRSCEVPERVGSAVASLITVALRAMELRDAKAERGPDISAASDEELMAELRRGMAQGKEALQ